MYSKQSKLGSLKLEAVLSHKQGNDHQWKQEITWQCSLESPSDIKCPLAAILNAIICIKI